MNKLIRVKMNDLTATVAEPGKEMRTLGGRGLTSHIICSEVPPACHPLSSENKLIFAPGLLAATTAPNSGRMSVGAKSPLTTGIKEANVGGTVGHQLGRLDIKAIVVEGSSPQDRLYLAKIDHNGVELIPADDLAGLGNYATAGKLRQIYGEAAGIICIGPAGEMRLAAASVAVTDPDGRPSRHAARGGLGAVMGGKGLKAIVIDDSRGKRRQPDDKKRFQAVSKAFTQEIIESKATALFSRYGTVGGLAFMSKLGTLPTRNFREGSFEGSEKIGGKAVAELNAQRGGSFGHVCMPGCVVRCSNVMHDRDGNFFSAGFEYESSAMLGANLGIDDLDAVIQLEKSCDDLGLDTMEIGAAIGVAGDAGVFDFGDGKRALELIEEIKKGSVLGRVLGQGAAVTARVFGLSRVPVVKGQAVPAHDPRKEIGTGIGYATSPQGADHTGVIIFQAADSQEMVDVSRQKQINTCAYDSLGLCQMTDPEPEVMADLVSAFYGWDWTETDVCQMGKAILKQEIAFNRAAGLGEATDRLPEFFRKEKLSPHKGVFDVSQEDIEKVLTP